MRIRHSLRLCALWLFAGGTLLTQPCDAETGYDAWLRYNAIQDRSVRDLYSRLPATIVTLDRSEPVGSAANEIVRGFRGMLGRTPRIATAPVNEDMLVLGTLSAARVAFPVLSLPGDLVSDGYWLAQMTLGGHRILLICAPTDRGVLYGSFALLRKIALHQRTDFLNEKNNPYAPVRWVNQWDNLDGSIERGYGGRSIFFKNGKVLSDLARVTDYARLLASLGINGCTVNNVNADPRVLSPDFLSQLARIANVFRPWGIRMSLAVDFSSPKTLGHLSTFDPLDPSVGAWWRGKADEVYRAIPDLAGFVLKADSEGRLGPSAYGRTHVDAANVLAQALQPHGGILIYRGFVYNHHLDWHNLKNDRARAAYENFHGLDGAFDDNVALQIKNGPIDFQVREPVSPLIGALQKTNETLELQITQEYTGQQRHLCYLVPMWKEILDFDLQAKGSGTPVKDIVAGRTFHRAIGGFVGVANVGDNRTWLGSDLAMANLYGFGRLAWNPDLSAEEITDEWTRLTFSSDSQVVSTVKNLELESWHVYQSYTGPLGLGTLTDILHGHYGPGIESAERNGWGQWLRADSSGIGMDRSVATGTGYVGQYNPPVARTYESLASTPDNLLLFMHHVPYSYVLHSGETVIQHVYDTHYAGAAEAQLFPRWWETLRGRVDDERYEAILEKLIYQAGHSIVWRDAVCDWFYRQSGIPDAHKRVGHHPDRLEAESMNLSGYVVQDVAPWEDASGGKAVACNNSTPTCTAGFIFKGSDGWFDLAVEYFDLSDGQAHFKVLVDDQQVDAWTANATLPSKAPNGDTSVRRTITGIALRTGDHIRIEGTPDQGDTAALDYVEISPAANP